MKTFKEIFLSEGIKPPKISPEARELMRSHLAKADKHKQFASAVFDNIFNDSHEDTHKNVIREVGNHVAAFHAHMKAAYAHKTDKGSVDSLAASANEISHKAMKFSNSK